MFISEIYHSRQGEGLLTGTPSVFVRTSGCNLRCGFCDTPFASWQPEGKSFTVAQVLEQIKLARKDAQHVVITGGEPMIARELDLLCHALKARSFHITIETAGTVERELECDLMSISPKFANSDPDPGRAGEWLEKHRQTRFRPEVVRQLISRFPFQLKFVVDRPSDVEEILEYLDLVGPVEQSRVLVMPQGVDLPTLRDKEAWLIPFCEAHRFVFCPRKHIEWYGNTRGT